MHTKTDGISSGLVAVEHQFQDREGKWHPFIDQRHYENTVADGSWPIRHLADISAAEAIIYKQAEQLQEAQRRRDRFLDSLDAAPQSACMKGEPT